MRAKETLYGMEGIECRRLGNGLTILTREDRVIPIVSLMLWYKVGSRCESPGITGISHFLEHMMFKGTDRYEKGEIDCLTLRNGGSNNAFTSQDYTAYYFSFASDRWWQALDIEANRMKNNRFDPREFELEKQVVIEERKMDLDTPWGALRYSVVSGSFDRHPYKNPVIGLYEDLCQITLDQMVRYYRQFYSPNNATLVVVGDIDTGDTLKRIEELFGPLTPSDLPEMARSQESPREDQRRITIRKASHVPRMLISFPAASVQQREHYATEILDRVLSDGKLSRLYRRLVEQDQVASLVTTEFEETLDPYLFFIRAELREDADLTQTEAIIFEEIERLRHGPISETELSRAKNQCITQFLQSLETPLSQAMQLGLMQTLDCSEYWHTYADRILALEAEEIQDVAQRWWSPERATVGTVVDEANKQLPFSTDRSG